MRPQLRWLRRAALPFLLLVALAYVVGRAVFGRVAPALAVAAFVAFLPQHLAILGSVNNDALSELIIAAILAHEATHIDRAVSGTACYYVDACTKLSNGVELEEEIVAHEAEAVWWLAAYGRNGKDRAFSSDASENRLKAAYLHGPDVFRKFVREMRSDEREGDGM